MAYFIILRGPAAVGKTTVAKALWEILDNNPAYLSLDSIKHFVYGARSEAHFLDLSRNNALLLTKNYLNNGHPVIIDKAFGNYEYVKDFVDLGNEMDINVHYFKFIAPLDVLTCRVEDRRNLPLDEKIKRGEASAVIPIFTHTTRVTVPYGHLLQLTIDFKEEVFVDEIKKQLSDYQLPKILKSLPSSPDKLFYALNERPNPKQHVHLGNGMYILMCDFQQDTPKKITFWTLT